MGSTIAARAPLRLGVLVSGRGTNLQSIIDAIERGELNAIIKLVISNRADAPGLIRAQRAKIPTRVIDQRRFGSREEFDGAMVDALRAAEVELVACAGFMRILSPVILDAFPNRIMNIHPSLLPAFPGLNAQKAALEHGTRLAGCTVFFVTPGTDDGPIIVQAAVPVMPDDDEQTLSDRILAQEHRIYPLAISLFQQGRLQLRGRQVVVVDAPKSIGRDALMNPPLRPSRS
ncbi:MAG TPA: phosphoribosylglycinamide formyltransferase [Candidatus Binataceae bacterium]|nr:phosphoribosylglycinamide formyltransferase [Candidatus Binataceae bacterium]